MNDDSTRKVYAADYEAGRVVGYEQGRADALEAMRTELDLLVAQRDAELTPLYRALYQGAS
jgi:hypothetical protein